MAYRSDSPVVDPRDARASVVWIFDHTPKLIDSKTTSIPSNPFVGEDCATVGRESNTGSDNHHRYSKDREHRRREQEIDSPPGARHDPSACTRVLYTGFQGTGFRASARSNKRRYVMRPQELPFAF